MANPNPTQIRPLELAEMVALALTAALLVANYVLWSLI
jgi:hypothetical protein